MSRAERFEDEKRRIIDTCFSKTDPNGQLAESYITHIRIQEDAQHASAPPPPDSGPENKKPRLIIIAVRSSGRVRMHKARENTNGSFSIGKTWNLEELSAIESYAGTIPAQSEREAQQRAWAGNVGFKVTITKPYYWQAGTAKEKDFFIASAVKIYRKYTKGQVPELRGFDDRERATILGLPPGTQLPPNVPPPLPIGDLPPPTPHHTDPNAPLLPPQPPFVKRDQSRDGSRYRQSPGPPSSVHDGRPGSGHSSRHPTASPGPRAGPTQPPAGPRMYASQEQMRGQSRDRNREPRSDFRPGTSPAPQAQRSASAAQSQSVAVLPPHVPIRNVSPDSPSAVAARDQVPLPLRPRSPQRQNNFTASYDGGSNDLPPGTPTNVASSSGADLFQAARQRYMEYQPDSTPPLPQDRLPPIQPVSHQQNGRPKTPKETVSATLSNPENSSAFDVADAAMPGGPDIQRSRGPTSAAPVMSINAEPTSPPTPLRSRRRPTMDHHASADSVDLRPAPLSQARAVPEGIADRAVDQSQENSTMGGPAEIKPLQVQNKPDTNLPVPGAFSPAMLQPTSGISPAVTPGEEQDQEQTMGEQYRPGLGPMFKKKALASRLAKAANAANAFKPRPGGAAEKILQAKAERDGEPDGITGVVPRPIARQESKPEEVATPVSEIFAARDVAPEAPPAVQTSSPKPPPQAEVPNTNGTLHNVQLVDPPTSAQAAGLEREQAEVEEERNDRRQIRQPQVKIKSRTAQHEKYLAALDIDRSLLEGKGLDFEQMLSASGWGAHVLQPKQLAMLEYDIRREQGRVEAGSWLSHTDAAREERVTYVENLLDKAIAECDELEGLLTLYHVELSSLNDDIAFIEDQSQGLQVQSANQKLLHSELQSLVDTMSLGRGVMDPLKYGDLSQPGTLEEIEASLLRVYQAMLTMDPSMRSNAPSRPRSRMVLGDNETSNMLALREKKAVYDGEVNAFCQRLTQFLDAKFSASVGSVKGRVLRVPGGGGLAKLHPEVFAEVRSGLWMYSPLILFSKEVNQPAWKTLMGMYTTRLNPLYRDALAENISNWKKTARATSADEMDILFTAQEKEDPAGGGLTSTARKLTVKRSQTLAKTLRNASGLEKHTIAEPKQPGAMMRSATFAKAMNEMAPLISQEQNFFVDLFHATSLDSQDFIDAVKAASPATRFATNVMDRKPTEPDHDIAKEVTSAMVQIFNVFTDEIGKLADWSVSDDPIQGVGVLASLNKHRFYLQGTNQIYLLQLIDHVWEKKLLPRFEKFVVEQIRAIEDTKVKIKKRKGVIAFMKIFPHFAAAVENVFSAVAGSDYDGPAPCILATRGLVDDAYDRINRAMFDSLKVIAKESPVAGVPATKQSITGGDDPEDKQMLNYHILLIENMNHYIEEVDDGSKEGVLAEWKGRAMMERSEALDAYVTRVIRRPLGKLLVSFTISRVAFAQSKLIRTTIRISLSLQNRFSQHTPKTLAQFHPGLLIQGKPCATLLRFTMARRSAAV